MPRWRHSCHADLQRGRERRQEQRREAPFLRLGTRKAMMRSGRMCYLRQQENRSCKREFPAFGRFCQRFGRLSAVDPKLSIPAFGGISQQEFPPIPVERASPRQCRKEFPRLMPKIESLSELFEGNSSSFCIFVHTPRTIKTNSSQLRHQVWG